MSLSPKVAQLQREHASFELECIDRTYLNASVPLLTSESGIAWYFRGHLGRAGALGEDHLVPVDLECVGCLAERSVWISQWPGSWSAGAPGITAGSFALSPE